MLLRRRVCLMGDLLVCPYPSAIGGEAYCLALRYFVTQRFAAYVGRSGELYGGLIYVQSCRCYTATSAPPARRLTSRNKRYVVSRAGLSLVCRCRTRNL